MRLIRGIYRYPIKGLSPQSLRGVRLGTDQSFPFDRVFALARPGRSVDVAMPKWAKKGSFVMLMLDEALAQVRTQLDVETLRFEIRRGTELELDVDLGTPQGREAVESFFRALVSRLDAPPRLVRAADGHFMDKPDNVVSLINLATVRSLEQKWGCEIDPLRFRANFYIDGIKPWEEFDWIGGDILLGGAVCHVDRRNGRCGATNVNPATGERDLDIPGSLRRDFGHKDLGVYLVVRTGGEVVVGDPVDVPGIDDSQAAVPSILSEAPPVPGSSRHICRGCYYIYEEARGVPQDAIAPGTAFVDIPPLWRCPDCGTGKTTFRPYTG